MLDPKSQNVIRFAADVLYERTETYGAQNNANDNGTSAEKIRLETALIADAVTMFSESIRSFDTSPLFYHPNAFCNSSYSWSQGTTVYNHMRTVCSIILIENMYLTFNISVDTRRFNWNYHS